MATEKTGADLILTNGYLITMDPNRRIIENGAVAIIGGKIAAVGKNGDILARYDGTQYDCHGGVVHPGLVDAHEHVAWHLVRGIVPDTFTVEDVWEKYENPIVHGITPQDEEYSILLATLEMAVNGTTIFGDTGGSRYTDGMFKGANIVGVKGYTSHGISDDYTPELKIMEYSFDRCIELFRDELTRYKRTGSTPVGAHVGLAGMEHTSGDLMVAAKELSREFNVQMQVHCSVYESEIQYFRKRYNKTPIEFYDDLGVLDEHTTLVHVIHTTDHDLQILEKRRPSVVHCPGASLRYGLGAMRVGRFKEMRERGVNVALGSDSGNWSDGLDIFQQMYQVCVGHRECKNEYPYFTREDAFEMATINGAKALGVENECGSMEPGKAADLVIHSTDRPEMMTQGERLMQMVYSSMSRSVDSVLVDGAFIVRNGKPTRVNLEELAPVIRAKQADMLKRMNYKMTRSWPVE
ncbi:MAG: amidohydrolase family protein [Eubacteriales bacterium]|nr:amidohydrolase family protein [Eubacteriales bacterium]